MSKALLKLFDHRDDEVHGHFLYEIFILLYIVVREFCLKLKISITIEPIGFPVLGELYIQI